MNKKPTEKAIETIENAKLMNDYYNGKLSKMNLVAPLKAV